MAERKKKIVRSTTKVAENTDGPSWTPTAEAKGEATKLRWIAGGLWLLAIVGEVLAIFLLLKQNPFTTAHLIWLIVAIVVIGVLASVGSVLWKKANRLDPASKKQPVRFFIQNQLGAIIAIIAFLPLIILIFTNKNMDGKQKSIAGIAGIVVAAVAVFAFGADYSAPSQEQYAEEENIIKELTGEDLVYWTAGGSVFHVCADVPDLKRESQSNEVIEGTVAQAHADGKDRLTLRWQSEATNHCGYTEEQVAAVEGTIGDPTSGTDEDDTEDVTTDEDTDNAVPEDSATTAPSN